MIVIFFAILIFSVSLVGLVRRYALAKMLIDIPNQRSSHVTATPRAGGIGIFIAFLTGLIFLFVSDGVTDNFFWVFSISTGLVAAIGAIDDHGHVPARWRLMVHFLSAGLIAAFFCWGQRVVIHSETYTLEWIGLALAVFYIVWLLNLFNFMDGINGLAGAEAASVCLEILVVYFQHGLAVNVTPILILLAAVLGFLPWNFPMAKIFMGDSGSGFLGVALAGLSLYALSIDPNLFVSWLILLGCFVVDATLTLGRRLARLEKIYEAHRTHAYQRAALRYGHTKVTFAVVAINFCWLLPWAMAIHLPGVDPVIGLIVAYAPLVAGAGFLGAGRPDRP